MTHDCLENSKVIDSRPKDKSRFRRRRCLICRNQWNTYEISDKTLANIDNLLKNAQEIIEFGLLEGK